LTAPVLFGVTLALFCALVGKLGQNTRENRPIWWQTAQKWRFSEGRKRHFSAFEPTALGGKPLG
jgi:hypothetical protein